MRIDMVRSAAGKKKLWLSELQGGRAAIGFEIFGKVRASQQQRWLWNGLASGADTLLIWCWRDEVFGRESSGLPPEFYNRYRDRLYRIPMPGKFHRSLNLANAASIVLYEALRQNREGILL